MQRDTKLIRFKALMKTFPIKKMHIGSQLD